MEGFQTGDVEGIIDTLFSVDHIFIVERRSKNDPTTKR
jgi:hypothetical protein